MSDITALRFSDQYRQRKAEVSQAFATIVAGEIKPSSYRGPGISVLSCTGPNVQAHWDEYRRILGCVGTLHIVENDAYVYSIIKNSDEFIRSRMKLTHGNIFDAVGNLHGRTKRIYLDFDLCRTFHNLVEQENLIEDIVKASYATRHMCQVWVTFTFSLRQTRQSEKQIVQQLQRAWIGNELELVSCQTYRDGTPMMSVLFRIDRSE